ncbi:formate dehydrogenase major subunit [Collimonas sp. OK607]|uniref:hypothetical protein n=1 Tax=Collimonas sp. OK607 TaxID=1798194 RepID=UPI0008E8E005|nr:hypothetical protein [Collimonas sp. OK607]SFA71463.1 formate dehydrogenase major subunit [Collimonas sp. OK607]
MQTEKKGTPKIPVNITTNPIRPQYKGGDQTPRTHNDECHTEDRKHIKQHDDKERRINEHDRVHKEPRAGKKRQPATANDRVQQRVRHTNIHRPQSGHKANTTNNSDWTTNDPKYNVTKKQNKTTPKPPQ